MIAKILKAQKSSRPVIDYNEKKMDAGNATIVSVKNIDSDDYFTITHTFDSYEKNPRISARARKLSFHMTVGPGPQDSISEENIVRLVEKIMGELKMDKQPYIIYRHNDIERGHYHIVSTRFNENGKKINADFDARIVNSNLKEMAPKMGFVVGNPNKEKKKDVPADKSIRPQFKTGEKQVIKKLEALYRRGLKTPVHSFYHLQAVMRAMNVRCTARKNKSGSYNILLRGLDKEGSPVTPYYSLKRIMKVDGWSLMEKRINEVSVTTPDIEASKYALGRKSQYCMSKSKSAEEYASMMEQLGVFVAIFREPKSRRIQQVTLADASLNSILDSEWKNEIRVEDFQKVEDKGAWKKDDAKPRRLSSEEVKEAFGYAKIEGVDLVNDETEEQDVGVNMD